MGCHHSKPPKKIENQNLYPIIQCDVPKTNAEAVTFKSGFLHDYKIIEDFDSCCFENRVQWQVARGLKQPFSLSYVYNILGFVDQEHQNKIQNCIGLSHPNIATLNDVYQGQGATRLIYEFFSGGRFVDQYSSQKQNYREKQISQVALQIFSGLDYLHKKNIIHGEINTNSFVCKSPHMIEIVGYAYGEHKIPHKTHRQSHEITHYFSPEQLKPYSRTTKESNVWACGVFIHYLLTGHFPFNERTESSLQNQISRGFYNPNSLELSKYSSDCRNFLQKIFTFKPNDRPTASQILKHSWLEKSNHLNTPVPRSVIISLLKTQKYKKIQEASLTFMVQQEFFDEVQEKLYIHFERLDKDNSGYVTKGELYEGLKDSMGEKFALNFIENIFKKFDGIENITFEQFSQALINRDRELSDKELLKTFNIIDKNQRSRIPIEEMMMIFQKYNLDQAQIKKILKKADKNSDGLINFEEFKQMMREVKTLRQVKRKVSHSSKLKLLQNQFESSPKNDETFEKQLNIDKILIEFAQNPDSTLLLNRFQRKQGKHL